MRKTSTNILLALTILICCLFYFMQGQKSTVFYGDALGYYLYLPTTFIYNNTANPETLPTNKGIDLIVTNYVADMAAQLGKTEKGHLVNQYTYGTAFFELPFFWIAHVWEKITRMEANGFSETYVTAIRMSGIFYLLAGLWLVCAILRTFVTKHTAIAATCFVLLGTNLFWFSFYQSGMSHIVLFCLYATLLYATIKLHKQPAIKYFILAGFAAGFITVIRPSDILCLLIPLLYNIYDRTSFSEKISFLKKQKLLLFVGAICLIIPILPQLIYWKLLTGSFFYDSYKSQAFDFLHPRIVEGLFGFKNGWLAYTPLMLFAIAGLFYNRHFKAVRTIIFVLLPVYVYVIYSWWSYNYINGFGSRPMIHLYPLLIIPFAILIQHAVKKHILTEVLKWMGIFFCCFINIKQSVQQAKGDMWSEDSNATFNVQTLFKANLSYNDLVVMDNEEIQPAVASLRPVGKAVEQYFTDSSRNKDHYTITNGEEFPPTVIRTSISADDAAKAKWIKVSGLFNSPQQVYDWYKYHLLVLDIQSNGSLLLWKSAKINNKIGLAENTCIVHPKIHLRHSDVNQWGSVHYFIKVPHGLKANDQLSVTIWNIGKSPLLVKQLKFELFR